MAYAESYTVIWSSVNRQCQNYDGIRETVQEKCGSSHAFIRSILALLPLKAEASKLKRNPFTSIFIFIFIFIYIYIYIYIYIVGLIIK
jgi:uncharacterized membrane protein